MRPFNLFVFLLCLELSVCVCVVFGRMNHERAARVVKRDERRRVFESGYGSISSVDVNHGSGRNEYHLQFIALERHSLFLPVVLHADMLFYVDSGSGILSFTEGETSEKMKEISLQRGDLYRLSAGSLFYLNSSSSSEAYDYSTLRITAIFTNPGKDQPQGPSIEPYSSINNLVRGFDKPVLQAVFRVPEEVIEELTKVTDSPAIVQADQQSKESYWDEKITFINSVFGVQRSTKQAADNKKKKQKHTKIFNFFKEEPDFENCYGWIKEVTKKDLKALHDSQIGVHMVNLTKGSMMGPSWNPTATEVSVVVEGEGMVQVVCAGSITNKECKSTRVRVEEGDVLVVPRFHPVAQMSFNNGSFVVLGFSTAENKKSRGELLFGKGSILEGVDDRVLSVALNVSDRTVSQLTAGGDESFLKDCTSCAEEMEMGTEGGRSEEEEREERRRREKEEKEQKRREEEEREEDERRRREEEEEKEKKRPEEEEERQEEEEREERRRRQEEEEERKTREEEEESEEGRGEEERGGRHGEEEWEEEREQGRGGRSEEEPEERWRNLKHRVKNCKRGNKWRGE